MASPPWQVQSTIPTGAATEANDLPKTCREVAGLAAASQLRSRAMDSFASGAFILQLDGESDPRQARVRGSVEHISSGQVGYFDSTEALLAFIADVLAEHSEA